MRCRFACTMPRPAIPTVICARMATTSLTSLPVADRVHRFTYAIRNIVAEAERSKPPGKTVRYLNIGDPIPFGFRTPAGLVEAVAQRHARRAQRLRAVAGHPAGARGRGRRLERAGASRRRRSRADHGRHVRRDRAGADGAGRTRATRCSCRRRPIRSTRRCSPRSAPSRAITGPTRQRLAAGPRPPRALDHRRARGRSW